MKSIKLRELKLSRTVMLLLVMLLTTATAGAQDTEVINGYTFYKNDKGSLLINSVDDWNNLAAAVAAGNECTGKNFVLTTDISITRPIGQQTTSNRSDRKRFAGTFDGGEKTLTVNLNTADEWFTYNKGYAAPFAYVKNTTIKNLHVVGTITTTGTWASGLIGSTGNSASDGKCTIENVQVSVKIINNYTTSGSSYANHGGFIGIPEGETTIKDSWFDGSFSGNDYKYSGGFIGLNNSKATLKNCLFNPSSIQQGMSVVGACEFVHDNTNKNGSHTLENCYSVTLFGAPENAQGIHVVAEEPGSDYSYTTVTAADGKTYYHITSNPAWRALVDQFASGGTIDLTEDCTAGSEDNCLTVPGGIEVILNMNGYTLDRGLFTEAANANGSVILVERGGKLTINGGTSNGTIKGGHNSGNGGGIYVNAGGKLTLTDVTVTENSISSDNVGGGVFVETDGMLYVSGTVKITNNATVTNGTTRTEKNLYLSEDTYITLIGKLTGSKTIGVTKDGNGVFTSGLSGYGNVSSFVSDNTSSRIVKVADGENAGEAALLQLYKVSKETPINGTLDFKVNDKNATTAVVDDEITLTVTPASGYQIASVSYRYNDGEDHVVEIEAVENAYSFTMPAADVTISATFELSDMQLTLNRASLNGVTKYWGTFYATTAYQLPEGAQAFYMKDDKSLYMVGDDGTVIPANVAVVVMSDGDLTESSITLTLTPTTADITVGDNFLNGTDSGTAVSSLSIESGKSVYVLSADTDGNLGFHKFTGDTIPANKAYYIAE